jgi:ElaB/YqjD/DUF883 family membrane-anchored ribosome-binding protein
MDVIRHLDDAGTSGNYPISFLSQRRNAWFMCEKTTDGNRVNIEQFIEDIKVVVQDGQELLRAGVGTVKERARAGAERTNAYIREKPYNTLGLAFGLGLLAGLLAAFF